MWGIMKGDALFCLTLRCKYLKEKKTFIMLFFLIHVTTCHLGFIVAMLRTGASLLYSFSNQET